MKTETCAYSGYKIYPGKGKRAVRADGKVHIFLDAKCERSFKLKRKPWEVSWTVLYRRKHKKGTMAEEVAKRKTKRTTKFQRAIGTTSLAEILAKRNQKPELRKAQRDAAIRAAKEQARASKAAKKVEKVKHAPKGGAGGKSKAPKQVKSSQPRVGGKR